METAYHGTNSKTFNSFDFSYADANFKVGVKGAFFAEDYDLANEYGDNVIDVEISTENSLIIDISDLKGLLDMLPIHYSDHDGDEYHGNPTHLIDTYNKEIYKIAESCSADIIIIHNDDDDKIYNVLKEMAVKIL